MSLIIGPLILPAGNMTIVVLPVNKPGILQLPAHNGIRSGSHSCVSGTCTGGTSIGHGIHNNATTIGSITGAMGLMKKLKEQDNNIETDPVVWFTPADKQYQEKTSNTSMSFDPTEEDSEDASDKRGGMNVS